jgi:ATP-dependent 26S proteasome regulatory subunit
MRRCPPCSPTLLIARELAPATVLVEDVDLVAAERTMHIGAQGILFELLNEMEGREVDADLLFILTTNRPDVIEPALAARPGRIDLALEVPLPDEAARRRLIRLYAGDVELDAATEDDLVARTQTVSGAFINELMRQAALAGASPARGTDVVAALDELLDDRRPDAPAARPARRRRVAPTPPSRPRSSRCSTRSRPPACRYPRGWVLSTSTSAA